MVDAAFDFVLDAVRDAPDEVAASVDRLAAEYGPDRINSVLDAVERRLHCQLPRRFGTRRAPLGYTATREGSAATRRSTGPVHPRLQADYHIVACLLCGLPQRPPQGIWCRLGGSDITRQRVAGEADGARMDEDACWRWAFKKA